MFIWGLCYCGRQLTDGFIAHGVVHGCVLVATRGGREKACAALVLAGLWVEVEGGWRIHDYLAYNPDRASVLENRQRAAERKRRSRAKQKSKRHGVTKPGRVTPVTAHPTPSPKKGEAAPLGRAALLPMRHRSSKRTVSRASCASERGCRSGCTPVSGGASPVWPITTGGADRSSLGRSSHLHRSPPRRSHRDPNGRTPLRIAPKRLDCRGRNCARPAFSDATRRCARLYSQQGGGLATEQLRASISPRQVGFTVYGFGSFREPRETRARRARSRGSSSLEPTAHNRL